MKSVEYHRDVVPVYFSGQNSDFFYKFAAWRKRIGMKLNIEMIYLPGEIFKSRGKEFNIIIGKPIPWQTFTGGRRPSEYAAEVRAAVYELKPEN